MGDHSGGRFRSKSLGMGLLAVLSACAAPATREPALASSSASVSPPELVSPAPFGGPERSTGLIPASSPAPRDEAEHISNGIFQQEANDSLGERLDRAPERSWGISESGPFRLEALAPGGSWVALCAESAQGLSLRLFAADSTAAVQLGLHGAIPRKVDRLLAWSPDGRYLVTLEGTHLWLLDLSLGTELDLSPNAPDLASDRDPDHRSVAFSTSGNELALLTTASSVQIIALPFVGAPIRTVTPSRAPWRIRYSGNFLIAESGPGGSWPIQKRQWPPLRCESSRTELHAFARTSEPSAGFLRQIELLRRDATSFEDVPGFVMTLGEAWVRREEDGRLLLVKGRVQKQLTSSRCGARVRYADESRELLLVACEKYRPRPERSEKKAKPKKPEYSFPLYLISLGSVRELGVEDSRASYDLGPKASSADLPAPELVPLTSSGQAMLVDLRSRTARPLASGERVLATLGRMALVQKGASVTQVEFGQDGARHEKSALTLEKPTFAPVVLASPFVGIGSLVLHPAEKPRGASAPPIALTEDGAALEPASARGEWFEGPLVISRPARPGD